MSVPQRAVWVIGWFLIAVLAILVITVPLDLRSQWIFAAFAVAGGMWFASRPGRRGLLTLSILSLLVSSRYLFWRTTQTLEFETVSGFVLGSGLYLAELYAWLILVLGFLQTAWPLDRLPVEPKGDPAKWPMVDVFIPTYNESLAIVRSTVIAALDLDYPQDRFRVFILDDGRRPQFQAFAREVGCGYLTRTDNRHAKAGNLNVAMRKTSGELIAVFDCDHVPTRGFLQLTVGWFQRDSKLALLQTPHHFYSPDPVQRNLQTVSDQPGEGDLFYGPIQKGNDLWNAAFFCGSCAVMRRTALNETRGFAGETVTEDAHTALKLQRKGWNTAYLGVRLAAGLATERLALHIGQRIRWARGMTQIMRIDNPLLGPGLSVPQRLCYLNAMMHFQFPLPRIVFLTSPLAYLLFGENIIMASASMIFAYAVPHLYCSMVSGTLVHGRDRRPFWSEIYETILAFHLVKPTMLTWLNPRKGKFNVTDKGGRLDRSYFDTHVVRPHLICIGLILAAILIGAIKLVFYPHLFNIQGDTYALNTLWATFSLLILVASVSVARESRQAREHVRIPTRLPATIHFSNGHIADVKLVEVSMGGMSAVLPVDTHVEREWEATHVSLPMGDDSFTLPAQMLRLREGRVTMRFRELDLLGERQLVRAVMGRADAWVPDRPLKRVTALRSLYDILIIDLVTIGRLLRLNRKERVVEMRQIVEEKSDDERAERGTPKRLSDRGQGRSGAAQLAMLALVVCGVMLGTAAFAQGAGNRPGAAQASVSAGARDLAPAAEASGSGSSEGGRVFHRTLTLRDLQIKSPVRLEGTRGEIGIPFGLRDDEVVTAATLTLNLAWSPALLGDLSQVVVLLNDQVVYTIRLDPADARGRALAIPVNPALFLPGDNRLNLRLVGHYTRDCEDPFHSSLWANISNIYSAFDLTVQRLPLAPDLARLPRPFFDPYQNEGLSIPFVFAAAPGNGELEAAASVASWLGAAASYRGFDFVPVTGSLPRGNAIVFLKSGQQLPGLDLQARSASARVLQNPVDPFGQILVIMGRDDQELKLAAAAIASSRAAFRGSSASLASAKIPNFRAYEAPRWLRTDRRVELGELVAANTLQGRGISPGPLSVQFRAAPDLFFWPRDGGSLRLRYRYPVASWLDKRASRLDVSLNGQFERTLPLGNASWWRGLFDSERPGSSTAENEVSLPRYDLYGQNGLVFDYQLVVANKKRCEGTVPEDVRVAILPDSEIDLTNAYHAWRMPDLAVFASAGYPFTVRPDLAETAVVLGATPTDPEIRAFLLLMGRFGDATGAAATRVTVTRQVFPDLLAEKDILAIGSTELLRHADLFEGAPLAAAGSSMVIRESSPVARVWHNALPLETDVDRAQAFVAQVNGFEGMFAFQSPFAGGRTVTAVVSDQPQLLPVLIQNMSDQRFNAQIQGDLAVFNGEGMSSFAVGPGYWVGSLPPWMKVAYWFSSKPALLVAGGLLIAIILTGPAYLLLKRRARERLGIDEEG